MRHNEISEPLVVHTHICSLNQPQQQGYKTKRSLKTRLRKKDNKNIKRKQLRRGEKKDKTVEINLHSRQSVFAKTLPGVLPFSSEITPVTSHLKGR